MHETTRTSLPVSIGLLMLRLGLGIYLATHGWGKMHMVFTGQFDQFGDPIGLGSGLSLVLAASAEFVCALFVALGFATRLAAIPIVITMCVAAFVVHGGDPWTMGRAAELYLDGESESWASKEPALLYLFPYLALVFTGPGVLSIDHLIWQRRHNRVQRRATSEA